MPELPEVETVCRALARTAIQRTVCDFRAFAVKLREPLDVAAIRQQLRGRKITAIYRRAKFILIAFDAAPTLMIHLGMTGSLRIEPANSPRQLHDRAMLIFADQTALVYHDPRKFGLLKIIATSEQLANYFAAYAAEPLSAAFSAKYLSAKNARSSTPVKTQIMKQEIVVGVGNIYASETLFRAKILPERPAKSLTAIETQALVRAIKQVLREAIRAGGTTISDYRQLDGHAGKFSRKLRAYGRAGEPCANCGEPIQKITQAGRSTFFCARCQK